MRDDIGPATKVMTEVAGSTFTVMSEAFVSTSEIVSTSLNNATKELGEFASEMKSGSSSSNTPDQKEESPPKPTNTSV